MQAAKAPTWRLIRLRDPQPVDAFVASSVQAVFGIGPPLARDIVVLASYSRPAPAGAAQQNAGTVYRSTEDHAEPVRTLSPLLDGVAGAAAARARLEPAYDSLLPRVSGRLASLFASLPERYVPITALERLQRLQPSHPLHAVYDPSHGFLQTRADAGLAGYTLALFKQSNGGDLLGVQRVVLDTQRTWFLRPPIGKAETAWQDVSAAVLPGWRADADYTLPRQGRMLTSPQGRWRWNGSRFEPL